MFAVIIDPSSGEEFERWELDDEDPLDCDLYAERYANMVGYAIAESTDYIPNCSGDFRVELREDPDNYVHIWNGKSYFFEGE